MIPFANPPKPGLQKELEALRNVENLSASNATIAQYLAIRMVVIYGLDADITIQYDMQPGEWRHVDRNAKLMRHGRPDVLPPKRLLTSPDCWPFFVAPDVAQRLVARDGLDDRPGKPI